MFEDMNQHKERKIPSLQGKLLTFNYNRIENYFLSSRIKIKILTFLSLNS